MTLTFTQRLALRGLYWLIGVLLGVAAVTYGLSWLLDKVGL